MKPEEADEIIAEFMGFEIEDGQICLRDNCCGYYYDKVFSESLDLLVPVWEKLMDGAFYKITLNDYGLGSPIVNTEWYEGKKSIGKSDETVQQAAAIATAKAIQELK